MQNAPINASLSPLQQQILGVLSQNPKASYELLVSKLGKDRTTSMRNIQKRAPRRASPEALYLANRPAASCSHILLLFRPKAVSL